MPPVNFPVPLPGSWPLVQNDLLLIRAFNSVTALELSIQVLTQTQDGAMHYTQQRFSPAIGRTVQTQVVRLNAGYLLSVAVHVLSGSADRGQVFVNCSLQRGAASDAVPFLVLFSDYVVSDVPTSWPGAAVRQPTESRGRARFFTVNNPAAGADFSQAVPTNALWRLLSIRFQLTTDANAPTRTIQIQIDDGTDIAYRVSSETTQGASDTEIYQWMSAGGVSYARNDNFQSLPEDLLLTDAHVIASNINTIQVADQLSLIELHVEEWIQP